MSKKLVDDLINTAQNIERWKHVETPPSVVINRASLALRTLRHTLLQRLHELETVQRLNDTLK